MASSDAAGLQANMSFDFIEGQADVWAEKVNLNAMIENAISPMRLNRNAPDDVRAAFTKRMKEQIDTIVRQAFAEGAIHALGGFAPWEEGSDAD